MVAAAVEVAAVAELEAPGPAAEVRAPAQLAAAMEVVMAAAMEMVMEEPAAPASVQPATVPQAVTRSGQGAEQPCRPPEVSTAPAQRLSAFPRQCPGKPTRPA